LESGVWCERIFSKIQQRGINNEQLRFCNERILRTRHMTPRNPPSYDSGRHMPARNPLSYDGAVKIVVASF
jgi:hypothetical protein